MCTVTIVPYRSAGCPHGGRCVRVGCNRDEQHQRPAALSPRIALFGKHSALCPVDPASGGTWIAANDAGMAFVLLNVNDGQENSAPLPLLSRGTVIPSLLHNATLTAALAQMSGLDVTRYAPFRLLVLDRLVLAEIHADCAQTRLVQCVRIDRPFLFTSSGLGDRLVEAPRRELFTASFGQREDWLAQQDRFHRHRWPECPHLSVCMSRPDARTVSYSLVDLMPEGAAFTYYPKTPDQPVEPMRIVLADALGGAA
jgi:hypothetical protein